MRASHVFDKIIQALHQRRIWAVGWITFGLQATWRLPGPDGVLGTADDRGLKQYSDYQPLMRYFMSRYGAYYNYFMWSPMWEMRELGDQGDPTWETSLRDMMTYLVSIDPWKRPQGAHDQARTYWEGWQTILPRQSPSRSTLGTQGLNGVNGNHRMGYPSAYAEGMWDGGFNYGGVIIGAEDIWEFCNGAFGKPRNATEVRRGLIGGLFANVLPMYDELVEGTPPCAPGLGEGAGEGPYKAMLDLWYGLWPNVTPPNYRSNDFLMLNHLTNPGAICSGVIGQSYVVFRENGGTMSLNLTGAPGTFAVTAVDAVNGTVVSLGNVPGGGPLSAASPFGAVDTLLFVRKVG